MSSFLPRPPPLAYAAGTENGLPVVLTETTNVVKHPEGGCPLQLGEGIYELRDDVHLATPPPHPSEPIQMNPNPLSTAPTPPTSGVKVTPVILKTVNDPPALARTSTRESSGSGRRMRRSKEKASENGGANFGDSKDTSGLKRRKPKNSIVKSTSTFVSRAITNDYALKKLTDRNPEGLFVFANINRAFQWLDFSAKHKQDPIAKILFTKAQIMCHDVNELTKSVSHLDVIVGFSTGDILWYDPLSQRYARLNKNSCINPTPVTHIKWIPGSENMFMAAHANGCLVIYDKEREETQFVAEGLVDNIGQAEESGGFPEPMIKILKSINSPNQKFNPVGCWNVSNHQVNNFAFSPDRRHVAIAIEDGTLKLMDYLEQRYYLLSLVHGGFCMGLTLRRLLDVFPSYYGGLLCVCWSPDGKYIVTGGQDDLVSIWSFHERNLVARCHGHNSWVSCVAFDPWRCDEGTYRFGSVGDDCRLLLWDFSSAMLHRPKAAQGTTRQHRNNSIVAGLAQAVRGRKTDRSWTGRLRSDSSRTEKTAAEREDGPAVFHAVDPKATTAQLPPILSKVIGDDPITWIGFLEDSIMTSSLEGHIRTWDRPQERDSDRAGSSGSGAPNQAGGGG
ncbi:hypothetical protein LOY98_002558 [Ophidiomyces ophidiicola]|nr:hypothetical protein LOY98_002558 [Ophidiomyces ophidiicola]